MKIIFAFFIVCCGIWLLGLSIALALNQNSFFYSSINEQIQNKIVTEKGNFDNFLNSINSALPCETANLLTQSDAGTATADSRRVQYHRYSEKDGIIFIPFDIDWDHIYSQILIFPSNKKDEIKKEYLDAVFWNKNTAFVPDYEHFTSTRIERNSYINYLEIISVLSVMLWLFWLFWGKISLQRTLLFGVMTIPFILLASKVATFCHSSDVTFLPVNAVNENELFRSPEVGEELSNIISSTNSSTIIQTPGLKKYGIDWVFVGKKPFFIQNFIRIDLGLYRYIFYTPEQLDYKMINSSPEMHFTKKNNYFTFGEYTRFEKIAQERDSAVRLRQLISIMAPLLVIILGLLCRPKWLKKWYARTDCNLGEAGKLFLILLWIAVPGIILVTLGRLWDILSIKEKPDIFVMLIALGITLYFLCGIYFSWQKPVMNNKNRKLESTLLIVGAILFIPALWYFTAMATCLLEMNYDSLGNFLHSVLILVISSGIIIADYCMLSRWAGKVHSEEKWLK